MPKLHDITVEQTLRNPQAFSEEVPRSGHYYESFFYLLDRRSVFDGTGEITLANSEWQTLNEMLAHYFMLEQRSDQFNNPPISQQLFKDSRFCKREKV